MFPFISFDQQEHGALFSSKYSKYIINHKKITTLYILSHPTCCCVVASA